MNEQRVILFGGASDERKVSVASAQHVSEILPTAELLFETFDGAIHRCDAQTLQSHRRAFVADFFVPGAPSFRTLAEALDAPGAREKTYLLCYHGLGSEDGTVQRLIEARGIAFTGSGAQASADAFDKERAKAIARRAGVRVVESVDLPAEADAIERALRAFLERTPKAMAKPIRGGSSVGLFPLARGSEVAEVAREIAANAQPYMVEPFIEGTELTVGVVQGPEGERALPCSEVRVAAGRSFDYAGKYLAQGTVEVTPAEVPPETFRASQALALAMHRALGCEGYSRTDLIVSPQGPVFLETNTLPGLTRASFIPQQLAAEGTSMHDFLEGQLRLARARRERQRATRA